MFNMEEDYNAQVDELRRLLKSPKTFQPAIDQALTLHAMTHTGAVSSSEPPTFCDSLLDGLEDQDFSVMPTAKDETIAWHLWHIARIEDLVGNLLIAEGTQVLDDAWMDRLGVGVRDTGNAMTDQQIMDFSKRVEKQALLQYRDAVGRRTRTILRALEPGDLKRKPAAEALDRLVGEGGLLEEKGSIWLKNFWGRHTVAGLILLPLTRHHMMHLPDSLAIKQFVQTSGTPFMS